MDWLTQDKEFQEQYCVARQRQAEFHADQLLEIADDGRNDTYLDDKGKSVVDYDHIQRSKLRVETRKWIAARLLPKKYGDRPAETHISTTVNNFVLPQKLQEQLQSRHMAALRQ